MSGQQGNPPLQQGHPAPNYQQYPGQRPATAYLPQQSQARPPAGQQGQRPQYGWQGGVPAVYSGLVRPQQTSDGRLSDLLTGQAGRPMYPASQGVSGAAVSQAYQQLPVAALQTGYNPRPAYPAASQGQPARAQTPQTQQQQAYQMYRPPASGAQAVSYPMPSQAHGYQPPPGSAAAARPGMQPRPTPVQTAANPNFYSMLRPGTPGYRPPTSAAIAQQYSALLNNLRPQMPVHYSPVPQLSEEDRKVLPKKSLKRKAVAAAGDDSADMDAAVEAALVQVADDFITSAVAFASGLARRRKSTKLEAADVALYLERTWQLRVPGFSGTQVKPYRRPVPKAQHQARTAVIRKETAAASEASEKAQAAADAAANQ